MEIQTRRSPKTLLDLAGIKNKDREETWAGKKKGDPLSAEAVHNKIKGHIH